MGDEDNKVSLTSHLEELRHRLLKSLIAIALGVGVSLPFVPRAFDVLESQAPDTDFVFTEVAGMIGPYIKMAFYCGFVLALPYLMYQAVMFISPGMTSKEKRYFYLLLPGVVLFFVGGACFGYFICLPPALRFLLGFGSDIAQPMISIGNYVSVVIKLVFWIGVVFEVPIIMFFLTKMGVVTPDMLSGKRKHAIVGAFVLAAIITPTPDPVNQSLVAFPIILLYGLGILLSKVAGVRKEEPAPKAKLA
jgi:sec-independent protein translocase protein TatC